MKAGKTEAAARAASVPSGGASCGLPEAGLEAVVASNLAMLRRERKLSLDALAQMTGLNRTLLGQLELGKSMPSVNAVWKIAQAFAVPFSALLATGEAGATTVLRRKDAKTLTSPDGRFVSRALYPRGTRPPAEFYELELAPYSREEAQAHQPGTRENLVVTRGRLDLTLGADHFELAEGDAIVFTADKPHTYANPGPNPCTIYLVMTYAGAGIPGSQD